MSDRTLRLQVVFGALDRLSAPLRGLREGSKGLSRDLAETQRRIAGLKRAQVQVGQYKGAEERYRASSAELAIAAERTAALRKEIAKVDTPTKAMARSLAAAEKAEAAASRRHEEQGRRLQELSGKLHSAGVDVADLGRHEDRLAVDLRSANKQLDAQRERLERVARAKRRGEALKSAGGRVAGAGAIATASITAPVVATIASSIPAAIESRKALADVNAALASMGPRAKRSIDQLVDQASRLQDTSLFDDDDIMKQVTANMLTFGNVTGKVFDRAQLAAVNLTARLGGDLQSRAIMVGKALNDPVKGITALGRAGVSLSEGQKKQIKSWVKHGQLLRAQGLILGELEKQYGGAAQAQREADPTAASQQAWRTFQESLGGTALTFLPALTGALTAVTTAFNKLSPGMQQTVVIAVLVAAAIGPILVALGALMTILGAVGVAFGVAFLPAVGIVAAVVAIVALLGLAAYKIYQNWGPISEFFSKLWEGIKSVFTAIVSFVSARLTEFGTAFRGGLWSVIGLLVTWAAQLLNLAIGALVALGTVLVQGFISLVSTVVSALPGILGGIWTALKWIFNNGLAPLAQLFWDFGVNTLKGFANGIMSALGWVKDTIVNVASSVVGWFKKTLGIHSPSRVFAQLGGHMMAGLEQGLQRGAASPIAQIGAAGEKLRKAMAASVLVTAPVGAAAATLSPDVHQASGASPARQVTVHNHYSIMVQGGPGLDVRAQARELLEEIKRLQAQDQRSSFEDDD